LEDLGTGVPGGVLPLRKKEQEERPTIETETMETSRPHQQGGIWEHEKGGPTQTRSRRVNHLQRTATLSMGREKTKVMITMRRGGGRPVPREWKRHSDSFCEGKIRPKGEAEQ